MAPIELPAGSLPQLEPACNAGALHNSAWIPPSLDDGLVSSGRERAVDLGARVALPVSDSSTALAADTPCTVGAAFCRRDRATVTVGDPPGDRMLYSTSSPDKLSRSVSSVRASTKKRSVIVVGGGFRGIVPAERATRACLDRPSERNGTS